jgi:hypothetical protein
MIVAVTGFEPISEAYETSELTITLNRNQFVDLTRVELVSLRS